jgi:hypothetical protein
MLNRRWVLAVLMVVIGVSRASAQTQIGSVSDGVNKYYAFTPSLSTQFTATLSWDNESATLFLVLVCGTNPLIFGAAVGGLDRTARLESGIIGLNPEP